MRNGYSRRDYKRESERMAKNGRGPVDWTVVVQFPGPNGCQDEVVIRGSAPDAVSAGHTAAEARSTVYADVRPKAAQKATDGA